MQKKYVGDVGDFGKYGLLRAICAVDDSGDATRLSLGVVWYLVPDESHNSDGKYTAYLDASNPSGEAFRVCDSALYDALQEIVLRGERDVKSIRKRGVLPSGTVYYESPLLGKMMRNFAYSKNGLLCGISGKEKHYSVHRHVMWFS